MALPERSEAYFVLLQPLVASLFQGGAEGPASRGAGTRSPWPAAAVLRRTLWALSVRALARSARLLLQDLVVEGAKACQSDWWVEEMVAALVEEGGSEREAIAEVGLGILVKHVDSAAAVLLSNLSLRIQRAGPGSARKRLLTAALRVAESKLRVEHGRVGCGACPSSTSVRSLVGEEGLEALGGQAMRVYVYVHAQPFMCVYIYSYAILSYGVGKERLEALGGEAIRHAVVEYVKEALVCGDGPLRLPFLHVPYSP